jgi:branched-subunit amino acid transport protein
MQMKKFVKEYLEPIVIAILIALLSGHLLCRHLKSHPVPWNPRYGWETTYWLTNLSTE